MKQDPKPKSFGNTYLLGNTPISILCIEWDVLGGLFQNETYFYIALNFDEFIVCVFAANTQR